MKWRTLQTSGTAWCKEFAMAMPIQCIMDTSCVVFEYHRHTDILRILKRCSSGGTSKFICKSRQKKEQEESNLALWFLVPRSPEQKNASTREEVNQLRMANLNNSSLDIIAMVSIKTKIVPPLISKSLFYLTNPIFCNFQLTRWSWTTSFT